MGAWSLGLGCDAGVGVYQWAAGRAAAVAQSGAVAGVGCVETVGVTPVWTQAPCTTCPPAQPAALPEHVLRAQGRMRLRAVGRTRAQGADRRCALEVPEVVFAAGRRGVVRGAGGRGCVGWCAQGARCGAAAGVMAPHCPVSSHPAGSVRGAPEPAVAVAAGAGALAAAAAAAAAGAQHGHQAAPPPAPHACSSAQPSASARAHSPAPPCPGRLQATPPGCLRPSHLHTLHLLPPSGSGLFQGSQQHWPVCPHSSSHSPGHHR